MTRRGIPPLYYIIATVIGLSAAFVFYGLFRELISFFGAHMTSMVSIIFATLLLIALGNRYTGKTADKTAKPLNIFIAFSIVAGIYILCHSYVFEFLCRLYTRINLAHDFGIFGAGVLRFVMSFLVLALPAYLMAGLSPLLIRHFVRHIDHSGLYMSMTIRSMCFGMLTGTLLSVFVIIPSFGIHGLIVSGAFILFIAALIIFMFLYYKRSVNSRISIAARVERVKKTMRFKKKKIVLEAGVRLNRAMIRAYIIQSVFFGSLVLLNFRILVNYSMIKPALEYPLILSITLLGIIIGSALYKSFAEWPVNKYMSFATLQIILGFGTLFSYAVFHISAEHLFRRIQASQSQSGLLFRQGILFAVLILIPAIINGMTFPLAGKLYPKRLQHIARAYGKLNYLFFISLSAGLLMTSYILIPLLGLQLAFFLLALIMLLSGIYLIYSDSRLIRGFRIGYAFVVILLFFTATGTLKLLSLRQQQTIGKRIEGSTASVIAVENKDLSHSVYLNGNFYFGTSQSSRNEQILTAVIPELFNAHIQSALVIEFGTGITASVLDGYDIAKIHICEMFPEIIRLSSDIFADENNDVLTSSHVDISVEDVRNYLARTGNKVDLITSATDLTNLVPGLYNSDFFRICYNRLSESGILCQVIPVNGMSEAEFRAICRSSADVFDYVSLWYLSPDKLLLVSSRKKPDLDYCKLPESFTVLNSGLVLSELGISGPESLLARFMTDDKLWFKTSPEIIINNNDHPYLEYAVFLKNRKNKFIGVLENAKADYSHLIFFGPECNNDSTVILNRIRLFNQSLLQQASLTFSVKHRNAVDFFEQTGSPILQYL